MTEQWYAVCDKNTGALLSVGTVLPSDERKDQPLPAHAQVIPLAERPDWRVKEWDPAQRALVPKVIDRSARNALDMLKRLTVQDAETILRAVGLTPARIEELKRSR